MKSVIVLNADYNFLSFCDWRRAITLTFSGKAEILETTQDQIKTISNVFYKPLIIRLVKLIRNIYKRRVPWSKKNVFIRDNYCCQYCNEKLINPDLEHIIPKSRGGKSTFENCTTACRKCNRKKGNKTPYEANMFLKSVPTQPTINEFIIKKLKMFSVDKILNEYFEKTL